MNIGIYLYDGYFETELSVSCMLFSDQNLITMASGQDVVRCMDGKKVLIDRQVSAVKPEDIDVLIIPGGKPVIKEDILELIRGCEKHGVIMGGICGGVDYFAHAGILKGRRYTGYYLPDKTYDFLPPSSQSTYNLYESDRNVVSAQGEAYLELGLELLRLAGILEPESLEEYNTWFKTPNSFKI